MLTYQCEWVCVDRVVHPEAVEQLYAAPEMSSIQAKTTAADWWSYGAILFGLLSGEVSTNLLSFIISYAIIGTRKTKLITKSKNPVDFSFNTVL